MSLLGRGFVGRRPGYGARVRVQGNQLLVGSQTVRLATLTTVCGIQPFLVLRPIQLVSKTNAIVPREKFA